MVIFLKVFSDADFIDAVVPLRIDLYLVRQMIMQLACSKISLIIIEQST